MRLAILGAGARMPALADAFLRERPGVFCLMADYREQHGSSLGYLR